MSFDQESYTSSIYGLCFNSFFLCMFLCICGCSNKLVLERTKDYGQPILVLALLLANKDSCFDGKIPKSLLFCMEKHYAQSNTSEQLVGRGKVTGLT